MKKKYIALALLLIMAVQPVSAVADQPPSKSKCQELFESCKDASVKLPERNAENAARLVSLCEDCKKKCSKENKNICKNEYKANPKKEKESFDGLIAYTSLCKKMCP